MAFLVALEGIDGSGKGTQAGRLVDRLRAAGHRAALVSFPRYEATLFGKAVGEYLDGRFGALDRVSPFLVSLLYAGDRFESRRFLLQTIARHEVVVLDRYVASNIAHQAAKLGPSDRDELVRWIERIEYEIYELPRADLTLLLDVPVEEARRRVAQKQRRPYTDKTADLQEADGGYLEAVRGIYRELAARQPDWTTVAAQADEDYRSPDDIAEELWRIVRSRPFADPSTDPPTASE